MKTKKSSRTSLPRKSPSRTSPSGSTRKSPTRKSPSRKGTTPSGSAYFIVEDKSEMRSHVLSVLVDNQPGVLARVIGLFSGRGYNIESLTVSVTSQELHLSRITIVSSGTSSVLEQIKKQLSRMVPVRNVVDLTLEAHEAGHEKPIERELALVKVSGKGNKRLEAMRLAEAFRAQVVDASTDHFTFEITGRINKVDQFIATMEPLGLVEVCRTGVSAVSRGKGGMTPNGRR